MSTLRVVALASLLLGVQGIAATPQGTAPHELFGFLLEQNQAAFDNALGKPFNTGEEPKGFNYRAYAIPGAKESYLVAGFKKDRAVRLELTGADYRGPTGFFGLTLGQDASAIEPVLGKPTEIRHEDDANVDLWDYKLANYSLEFTPDHKLYSIQVVEDQPRKPSGFVGSAEVRKFALAVQAADVSTLLQMSSGSLICTNGSELGFAGAARTDLADPNGKLLGCMKKAAETIISLGPKMLTADDQLRVTEKVGALCVTKFAAPSALKEVVFTWEIDAWRVYEVTFR